MDASTDSGQPLITHLDYKLPTNAHRKVMEGLIKLPSSLEGISAAMASQEIFEAEFGITPYSPETDPDNPTPLSVKNPKIAMEEGNPVKGEMRRLLRLKAPTRTGMSLIDLLNLPPLEYQNVIELLEEMSKDKAKTAEEMQEELENALK